MTVWIRCVSLGDKSLGNRFLGEKLSAIWMSCCKGLMPILVVLGLVALLTVGLPGTPARADNFSKQSLMGFDFSNQDLTDSSFNQANLRQSDFNHANLQGVSLFGANLDNANLEGADLSYATLDTARLTRANLKNAVLEGAFAFNAKFDGAMIEGADFTDILMRLDVQEKLCDIATGTNPVTGRNTYDSLDCY